MNQCTGSRSDTFVQSRCELIDLDYDRCMFDLGKAVKTFYTLQ